MPYNFEPIPQLHGGPGRIRLTPNSNMAPNKILWIYIVFLVIGGLIGYFKAKSPVSLILSVAFAVVLSMCAAGIIFKDYVADIFLAALMVVFAMRLAKTRKFMPAGLMLIVTLITLALRHI